MTRAEWLRWWLAGKLRTLAGRLTALAERLSPLSNRRYSDLTTNLLQPIYTDEIFSARIVAHGRGPAKLSHICYFAVGASKCSACDALNPNQQ